MSSSKPRAIGPSWLCSPCEPVELSSNAGCVGSLVCMKRVLRPWGMPVSIGPSGLMSATTSTTSTHVPMFLEAGLSCRCVTKFARFLVQKQAWVSPLAHRGSEG